MTFEAPKPTVLQPWYKKWWIWALVVLGVFVVGGILLSLSVVSSESAGTTTTIAAAPATSGATTTTVAEETTTTSSEPPTTTTTLPAILAAGEGEGDDVVEFVLPNAAVVIELTHEGSANFIVNSFGSDFEDVDVLVNEIGDYRGTRAMQWYRNMTVAGLDISADGRWTYEVRELAQEPLQSCLVGGDGDDVVLIDSFIGGAGTADLTHNGESNFIVYARGTDGSDLLVNELGAYEGTVRVSAGSSAWDITADGDWTVDCQ